MEDAVLLSTGNEWRLMGRVEALSFCVPMNQLGGKSHLICSSM